MFLNKLHENRFNELIIKDNTYPTDLERKALFFIIAGNSDLSNKVTFIYNFDENTIMPENLSNGKVDFCSSSRQLIKLAYNLYNSYEGDSVIDTFYGLDDQNFELAMRAIKVRFYGFVDWR